MNIDDIKTFLIVAQYGNINDAADLLFISQGTASSRIKKLEEELNLNLFKRSRGSKNTILTPQGREFLPMAKQFMVLYQDAMKIQKSSKSKIFSIACNDFVNMVLLPDFYKQFMAKHADIPLNIRIERSTNIYDLLEKQHINIGLIDNLHTSNSVIAKPLLEEELAIIYHKDSLFAKTLDYHCLDGNKEIGFKWTPALEDWHKQFFSNFDMPAITINSTMMLEHFLTDEDKERWALCTAFVAKHFCAVFPSYIYQKLPDSPKRFIYIITNKYTQEMFETTIKTFEDELREYLTVSQKLNVISF